MSATVQITVGDRDLMAEVDGDEVTISYRDDSTGGRWAWAGTGRYDGGIECTADLGDEAYEALDAALLPSDAVIRELEQEAAQAGDPEQVALCRKALAGDEDARHDCAQVISEARNY